MLNIKMLMLTSVLNNAAPNSWEKAVDYSDKRFALFELNVGDTEYTEEINAFVNGIQRIEVKTLKRVQNPFTLGSFILRKQQKEYRNDSVTVEKRYHPIHRNDLNVALEFNMDVRRYTHMYGGQSDLFRKNPKFYKTPGEAYNALDVPEKIILICNVLGTSVSYEDCIVTKENAAEYMATYVVDV